MESEQHVIQGWTKDGPHHLGKLGEHIVVETYMDIEGEREKYVHVICVGSMNTHKTHKSEPFYSQTLSFPGIF